MLVIVTDAVFLFEDMIVILLHPIFYCYCQKYYQFYYYSFGMNSCFNQILFFLGLFIFSVNII